ncbi:NUDIX hydrolase [Streptococcus himalayensis]|uniref:DNA mismatch repair protein MutT n=1 Tax=Streptococcus himalayensis TaxID=1888195 RepID=A0A917A7K1_9STRE|nr:NUDIX domain-containing protein [Streptococcus himalayensis]GGE32066.1 DNA mismatch repair protein MutT [Streptococcus himalayensis]
MDISFLSDKGKFNFRVCAIILDDGKILAMKDERSPYYYLPGGRVKFGETAEEAIIREVKEELEIEGKIIRPLWLNQGFFEEDVDKITYHEICVYFLIDISHTKIAEKGKHFILHEHHHAHEFEWFKFEDLNDLYFYPLFLKKEIVRLPDEFTLRTEIE